MAKRKKSNQTMKAWIDAQKRHHLSHGQVQMAGELALNLRNWAIPQLHAGALEGTPAAVHRRAILQTFRQDCSRYCDVHRGASSSWSMKRREIARRGQSKPTPSKCDERVSVLRVSSHRAAPHRKGDQRTEIVLFAGANNAAKFRQRILEGQFQRRRGRLDGEVLRRAPKPSLIRRLKKAGL